MGTSKSYSASIKGQPQWGDLSRAVTTSCGGGIVSRSGLGNILSRYVRVIGGSSGAGRGGSKIGGRAGIRTGKQIGGFLGGFIAAGNDLPEALEQCGITDLDGKSVGDIIDELVEHCSGAASTLDDVAAKTAAQKLMEELAAGAGSVQEFQDNLQDRLGKDSQEDLLIRYFGYYVFEHLSIMFYEKLVAEKGKSDCNSLFSQIRDYIQETLKTINKTNPLNGINWASEDAERLIRNILEDVLKVFEGHES